jgi:hypothetical protein
LNDPRLKKQQKVLKSTQDKEIEEAFKEVSSTPEGQTVLRFFMETLGWKEPMLAINPKTQEIIELSTIYNVSKRDVWMTVRELIPVKQLNAIEMEKKRHVRIPKPMGDEAKH